MEQPTLDDFASTRFGGSDYNPARDRARMSEAMLCVFDVMAERPHDWFHLEELAHLTGVPQSSVGSYLCYLRRDFHFKVPKEYEKNGLYRYKLGDRMSPEEIKEKQIKKMKPIGDKELFGEMMRSMYACAHEYSVDNLQSMEGATKAWQDDMVDRISVDNNDQ